MSITLNTTLYLSSCNFLLILVTAGCSTAFVDFEFYLRQPDTDILFKRFTADVSWLPVRKYTYPGSCEVNWLRLLEIRLSPNRKLVYQITTIKLHFGNWVPCHSSIRYERLSEFNEYYRQYRKWSWADFQSILQPFCKGLGCVICVTIRWNCSNFCNNSYMPVHHRYKHVSI